MPTTLTGEVERVTFENDQTNFRVIKLGKVEGAGARSGPLAVIGTFQPVGPGTSVRVTGDFVRDARHGEQFKAESLVAIEPSTLAGVEKYLGSGSIAGIGPGFAKRIVEKFGVESLRVLDSSPERLTEVPGIGKARIEQITRAWSEQRAISNIMMLLSSHGASPALAARIFKHYGERAAAVVQRSPYRLALEVRGVGFKTADRLAESLGIRGDHPERAQAGVMHELGSFADAGHVFAPRRELSERAAQMLEIDSGHVEAAIDKLWAAGRIVVEDEAVFLLRLHRAESELAADLQRLGGHAGATLESLDGALVEFEKQSGLELATQQRDAIVAAATHKVVIITGGPGVGKTTIVRAILSVFRKARLAVRLAAPTGRAAKRMSEATSSEAMTIHRLLEFDPRAGGFQRNRDSRLEADAVIVDEASMIDVALAAALLAALPDHARLVIVGDADQLPSVGPGAVLRDLLESRKLPSVRLSEVFRQAGESRIVQNAHRIFRGEMPESANADAPNADFFVIQRREPEQAAELIRELVTERIPRRFALDRMRDVQVLVPMHRGPVGTTLLNASLQAALNPNDTGLHFRGNDFRVGDKVMQTRNDYERETFNGDIGFVADVSLEDKTLRVRFDERLVEYSESDLDSLVLAYATSIHKSQGSEYPAVVIPLLTSHFVMLSRNLLYTAVTRAKRLCVLVADPRALSVALGETRREDRLTRLADRLRLLD